MSTGLLITGCNHAQLAIADETVSGIRYWCEQNGWDFGFYLCPQEFRLHPHFWKWAVARKYAYKADQIMWLDVDVILFNPERKLPEPQQQIHFSQDQGGLCCGGWLAKGGSWLEDFSATLLAIGPNSGENRGQDQDLVKYLAGWGQFREAFGSLSFEIVSNQDIDIQSLQPLWHHLWGNQGVERTVRKARELSFKVPEHAGIQNGRGEEI